MMVTQEIKSGTLYLSRLFALRDAEPDALRESLKLPDLPFRK
ncbi:MAG: hypothetical protein SO063_05815 [Eubacteriales bacterium]|nr:hypothetical protein [Eubacteriales bacterium]